MEKYGGVGQATDGSISNTAHALCMLDKQGCRHTLRICNTYCFPTVTGSTRTHLRVTFVYVLPVFFLKRDKVPG